MILSGFSPLLRVPLLAGLTRDSLLRMDPETAHGATITALRLGLGAAAAASALALAGAPDGAHHRMPVGEPHLDEIGAFADANLAAIVDLALFPVLGAFLGGLITGE